MFNNRMLAVAAVLAMAVPALGAATPIVVPPVPEQLVEGHTVFTVIEIVAVTETNETRFAAAVAVLVREYQAENTAQRFPGVLWFNDQYLVNPYQNAQESASFRYPCGGAVMAVNAGDPDPRVVIADVTVQGPTTVQADIPDPVDDTTGDLDESIGGARVSYGDDTQTYNNPPWVKPYPGTYTYENDYTWVGANVGPTTVNETTGVTTQGTFWSDTVVGSALGGADAFLFNATPPWDYRESYLITDPNDHSWIIDKYNFYTRDTVSTADGIDSMNLDNEFTKFGAPDNIGPFDSDGDGTPDMIPNEHFPEAFGGDLRTLYEFPVWVVNMLGSPVFIPDNGIAIAGIGENCVPFKDLIESVTAPLNGALCGVAIEDGNLIGGNDSDITLNAYNGVPPWTDNPCMSYEEPSRNGFCYGGQTDVGTGCPHGSPGNDRKHSKLGAPNEPLRQYNALLYFKLQDLRVWDGTIKDHCNFDAAVDPDQDPTNGIQGGCNPANGEDTNGCSEEQYPWGPNPPQAANDWPCPDYNFDGVDSDGDGSDVDCDSALNRADDCEGNSHPFHPLAPPHNNAEECLPQFLTADPNGQDGRRRNQANHGGSSYINPNTRATDDGWYQVYAPCDYAHTTRNVDIYFSPAGRPFPPPVRDFDVVDLEGSSAPFQDFHLSYPGVS